MKYYKIEIAITLFLLVSIFTVLTGCKSEQPEATTPKVSKYTVYMVDGTVYQASRFETKGDGGMMWVKPINGKLTCYNRESIDYATFNR